MSVSACALRLFVETGMKRVQPPRIISLVIHEWLHFNLEID